MADVTAGRRSAWGRGGFVAVVVLGHLFGGTSADFVVYATAASRWLTAGAGAVYDAASLTPFKYHPATLAFFAPFGLLPLAAAKIAWALLQGLLLADLGRELMRRGVSTRSLLLAGLWTIHAWTWQFKFGNVTVVMLWLFVRFLTAGSALGRATMISGLMLLKPQWGLLWGLRLIVGHRRESAYVVLLLLTTSAAVFLLGPTAATALYEGWFATLRAPLHAHNYPKHDNQSMFGLVARFTTDPLLPTLVSAVTCGVLLWLWYRSSARKPDGETWFLWLTVPIFLQWCGPLSWIHQEILFLPLIAALWERDGFSPALFLAWMFLNGTGELFFGRAGFVRVNEWGVPLLGYLALLLGAMGPATRWFPVGWKRARQRESLVRAHSSTG